MNDNILEFAEATPEEEAIAKKAADLIGDSIFFSYNLPIQIFAPSKEEVESHTDEDEPLEGCIQNYMPRRCAIEEMSLEELGINPSDRESMRPLCDTTIAILKNLIRQWEKFRDGKTDCVYYPNTSV